MDAHVAPEQARPEVALNEDTKRELTELEDMARSAFEEVMANGVNLDAFIRLAHQVAAASRPTARWTIWRSWSAN